MGCSRASLFLQLRHCPVYSGEGKNESRDSCKASVRGSVVNESQEAQARAMNYWAEEGRTRGHTPPPRGPGMGERRDVNSETKLSWFQRCQIHPCAREPGGLLTTNGGLSKRPVKGPRFKDKDWEAWSWSWSCPGILAIAIGYISLASRAASDASWFCQHR